MATRPTLKRAVAKTKSKASDYNDNFDAMMDFIDDSVQESKTYVEGFMPSITGQSGKYLTNNGTTAGWAAVPSVLPDQTDNEGKFLTTDGSVASWAEIGVGIVDSYKNGSSWYRVWAEDSTGYKWCEQGGKKVITQTGTAAQTVDLLKNFVDTNYTVICTKGNDDSEEPATGSGSSSIYYQGASQLSTSSFKTTASGTGGIKCIRWVAFGYTS